MEYQLETSENDYCSEGMISVDKKCHSCTFPNCGKIFRYLSEFKRHNLTHTLQRPFNCPFTNCRKKFKREESLKDHIRTHTGEKPYACQESECGKNFLSKAALRYHMLKHKGEKQYRCSFPGCNKAFLTTAQLKQHEDTQKCHQNISNHLIYGPIQECLNFKKNNESSNDDSFGLDIKVGKELEEKKISKREFMSIELSGDDLQVQFSRIAKLILDENNAIKTRLAMHEKLKRLSQENEGMDENLRAFSEAEEHKQFLTQEFSEERIFQFLKFND